MANTKFRIAAAALMFFVFHSIGVAEPPAPPSSASPSTAPVHGNFFQRLEQFYAADWAGTLPSAPSSPKRVLPSPLDSPPFPSSDWGYGGSPEIGAADGNVYPLMTAAGHGTSRTKVYGWIAPNLNLSTSGKSNYPLTYAIFSNRVELSQAVVNVERLPDTVQQHRFDYGYHLTAFYGTDYRFTIAKDYLSQQLLRHNRQYGFDPLAEYIDLYFPHVAEGLNIRVGRWLSVPGIETQLAPSNYTFTHSLLYSVDPSTDTGVLGTVKLSQQWLLQLGLSAGNDVAPWSDDRKASLHACANYTTASTGNNYYVCANGINNGKYAYNNVQQLDATWYHRFNKQWHTATEAWVMYEREVPNVARNVVNPVAPEKGTNGAFCGRGLLRCTAPEYAIVNYLNREITPKLSATFRSDLLDDKKGQRTGIPTKDTENTLSFTRYVGTTVLFRPEIRFDHSWDRRGYNNGRSRNQFTFSSDLIYRF